MASKNVEKLASRLNTEFNLNVSPDNFQRTYAGINMRRAGAFIWLFNEGVKSVNGVCIVGGCEPISKYIVKRNRLEIQEEKWGEVEVYAYSPDEVGYDE